VIGITSAERRQTQIEVYRKTASTPCVPTYPDVPGHVSIGRFRADAALRNARFGI